ncbi:hypothetical protein O6H91_13G071800 [Diphasiastrum complanatum]|uniref:Uncharacterized protein n=1 Tax=Diphasiastrum complanatum TaxID=34168 RepID=A0ACC2BWI1_DIPCM|nr:hypothetical protein O6H91_13G071800 [Diphasiastrum complanatum]
MSVTPVTPTWLDKGDNAWQMTAATLVGLQSVPGLVILYGSIVKKKWAVNSAFMALYAFAAVLICWVAWAYKMAFGKRLLPLWGKAGPALYQKYLVDQATLPSTAHYFKHGAHAGMIETPMLQLAYPIATMVYFQFVFAAITLILLAGSLLGRMNILAWMIFVPLWLTFSYTVGAFSLWGGGFLFHWGVIDYSGGYVIHLSSGVAGFTAAYWVGPRLTKDRERFPPNNILLTLAGAGLLWLGWAGFNGGDPYSANIDASMAVLNTNIAAAASLLTWTIIDVLVFGKPSVIGAVQGMITGLVCITPGAGLLGGLLTGLFAEPTLCSFFLVVTNSRGAIYGSGGGQQFGRQLVGGLFIIGWNIVVTSIILVVIGIFVSLRMPDEQLVVGDDAVHGEEAYALWGDGEKFDMTKHGVEERIKSDEETVYETQSKQVTVEI